MYSLIPSDAAYGKVTKLASDTFFTAGGFKSVSVTEPISWVRLFP